MSRPPPPPLYLASGPGLAWPSAAQVELEDVRALARSRARLARSPGEVYQVSRGRLRLVELVSEDGGVQLCLPW